MNEQDGELRKKLRERGRARDVTNDEDRVISRSETAHECESRIVVARARAGGDFTRDEDGDRERRCEQGREREKKIHGRWENFPLLSALYPELRAFVITFVSPVSAPEN